MTQNIRESTPYRCSPKYPHAVYSSSKKKKKESDQALSCFLPGRVSNTHESRSTPPWRAVCGPAFTAGGDPWSFSSDLSCLLLHGIGYFWLPTFNEHNAINKLNKYGTLRDDGGGVLWLLSHVQLIATPRTVACQAPLSL